jgi:hypothetical protein
MGSWHRPLIVVVSMFAALGTVDAHVGAMAGRSAAIGFHGFHGNRTGPFRFGQRNFWPGSPRFRFGTARFEGWGGGAYSAGVAGFDYDDDDGFAPDDLHFRVQESFGPGDIGQPARPPVAYDYGPWGTARMDPWHGYEPSDW